MSTIISNYNAPNVFVYGAMNEKYFENVAADMGYTRKTTFFSDLSIAEWYGLDAIKETFNDVMKSWINDPKYIAEFALSLNWKSWQHHAYKNDEATQLYIQLYYDAEEKIYKHFSGNEEATSYIFSILD